MRLKIEYVDIDSIKPYKGNAKIHTPAQIEQIKKSIQNFKMNDPIGIWHDECVEGHGRLIACKELGFEKVPIIRLDDLTDEQRKAYAIIHNKITMETDFDMEKLERQLSQIVSINMTEFDFTDIDEISEDLTKFFHEDNEQTPDENKNPDDRGNQEGDADTPKFNIKFIITPKENKLQILIDFLTKEGIAYEQE